MEQNVKGKKIRQGSMPEGTIWKQPSLEDELSSTLLPEHYSTTQGLCNAIAGAAVLHDPLSQAEKRTLRFFLPSARLCACTIALAGERGNHLRAQELLQERLGESCVEDVGDKSALWKSFAVEKTLVWRRSDDALALYPDWRHIIDQCSSSLDALVTVPLQTPGSKPMGALTFALTPEPDAADVASLENLARKLCGPVEHCTCNLCEISLDYLMEMVPPSVLPRMLSSASTVEFETPRQRDGVQNGN